MRRERSIGSQWFEDLYHEQGDPWQFETSPYEQAKYAHSLSSLPNVRFSRALEIGCANGVFTKMLAPRCDDLLAVDVSTTALASARQRCLDYKHVTFEERRLPEQAPDGSFDLVILSEVVYYWDSHDLTLLSDYLKRTLLSGGHLLLVHWIGETDYPKTADEAVSELRIGLEPVIETIRHERLAEYRLDLWRRD